MRPTDRILPWASQSAPWTGVHPSQVENYGTLFATPVSGGAFSLSHDKAGRHHVATLFRAPADVEEFYDRRWVVVRLVGPAPKSAVARQVDRVRA